MRGFSLRYLVRCTGPEQLWFPAALWILFVILLFLVPGPDRVRGAARAYLGFVVPLAAGVMAAYSVLDDPALELRFSTPVSARRTHLERIGLTLFVATICAMTFQILLALKGTSLLALSDWRNVQMAWLIPTLSLAAVGSVAALVGRSPSAGALAAGLIWLVELITHSSLVQSPLGSRLFIFLGALAPHHPGLAANRVTLLAIGAALFLASERLLRSQERYL